MKQLSSLFFALCAFCVQLSGQNAGSLDSTFGSYGFASSGYPTDNAIRSGGVVIQADSSIVTLQCVGGLDTSYIALERFLPDGSVDNSFGTNGLVLPLIPFNAVPQCIALQADGKILVGGSASNNNITMGTVSRFNTNGTSDATFGTGGTYNSQFPGSTSDNVVAISVLDNGEIIAGGTTISNLHPKSSIIKLTSTGTLDSTFGTNGRVKADTLFMYCMTVQSNGKIVLGGIMTYMAMSRFLPNGTPDSTFGTNGIVITNNTYGYSSWPVGIFALPNGKILAGGEAETNQLFFPFEAMQVDSNGVMDASYGSNGTVIDSVPLAYINEPAAAALQADGKLVIAASTAVTNTSGDRFSMVRFNANGTVDETFGTAGEAIASPGGYAYCNGIAIQADQKIVLSGGRAPGSDTIAITVARFGGGSVSTGVEQPNATLPELIIYPNPSTNNINIQASAAGDYNMIIFNMLGEQVALKKITIAENQNITLNINALPAGVYQIALTGKSGNQCGSFVKQ
jgi:uncharacterized delta-60 repeat protein